MRRGAALPLHAASFLLMNSKIATIEVAETKININLLFEETAPRFGPFLCEFDADAQCIGISEQELAEAKHRYPEGIPDSVVEFNELMPKVSMLLLDLGMATFHGMAFIWNEKAWIFTAPSGTGKTTQFMLWKYQFKDEIRLLNGDKTVLRCEDDGSVTVFPSPWAGKESMSRMESAPLDGIIYLSQDSENSVEPINITDTPRLFSPQFIYNTPTDEEAKTLNRVFRAMISVASLWHLKNKGDLDSAKLAHDTILNSL